MITKSELGDICLRPINALVNFIYLSDDEKANIELKAFKSKYRNDRSALLEQQTLINRKINKVEHHLREAQDSKAHARAKELERVVEVWYPYRRAVEDMLASLEAREQGRKGFGVRMRGCLNI